MEFCGGINHLRFEMAPVAAAHFSPAPWRARILPNGISRFEPLNPFIRPADPVPQAPVAFADWFLSLHILLINKIKLLHKAFG
jgi:hypothetical protein